MHPGCSTGDRHIRSVIDKDGWAQGHRETHDFGKMSDVDCGLANLDKIHIAAQAREPRILIEGCRAVSDLVPDHSGR
jgi:hypothetical protein